jgi:hypothetical protein
VDPNFYDEVFLEHFRWIIVKEFDFVHRKVKVSCGGRAKVAKLVLLLYYWTVEQMLTYKM